MKRWLVWFLAAAFAVFASLAGTAAAGQRAKPKIKITNRPAVLAVGSTTKLSGRVLGRLPRKAKIVVQQGRRRHFSSKRAARIRRRRFSVAYRAPAAAGTLKLRLRVRVGRRTLATSRPWSVKIVGRETPVVPPPPPPPPPPRTQVIAPSSVAAAPDPGADGDVRFVGAVDVRSGDILAAGVGDATPYGLLRRVTAVRVENGSTVVTTTPATLDEALPEGAFSESVAGEELDTTDPQAAPKKSAQPTSTAASKAGMLMARVDKKVTCASGASLDIEGNVGIYPSIEFEGGWSLLHGPHAKLVGKAEASTSLSASAQANASCTFGPKEIWSKVLKPYVFSVGPVPVVLVPKVTVDLSGDGSVDADVDSEIHGSITAEAGIDYSNGEAHPISSFDKGWGFTPPNPTGHAHLAGTVSPRIDVLLYGVGGPRLTFNAGLAVDATVSAEQPDPQWQLTAPVSLKAKLAIPALKIDSPELTVYEHTFLLASNDDTPVQGQIAFDEFPTDTTITDQYRDKGVLFDSDVFITDDGSNPTSPVLSGTPQFDGPIVGHFEDASGNPTTVNYLQLDAGYIDSPGSVEIVARLANGTTRTAVADHLGIDQISIAARGIKSFSAQAVDEEPAGFAIDNLGFGR